ncbi:MAG: MetQ/NlpA family ABC transporter substrate-binding protein, partial [Clostridia bacterium]|nr:MetQ/NlpA family ABC transporter substrate-binding protein [Clostridia bacterium]
MKKLFTVLLAVILCFATLSCASACAGNNQKTIKVGASALPHAEILNAVKGEVEKRGYTLKVVVYDDYVFPNTALEEGELDANYFQHEPYLNDFNLSNNTHIVSKGKIHYEPL